MKKLIPPAAPYYTENQALGVISQAFDSSLSPMKDWRGNMSPEDLEGLAGRLSRYVALDLWVAFRAAPSWLKEKRGIPELMQALEARWQSDVPP